jgi:hypothetical protein
VQAHILLTASRHASININAITPSRHAAILRTATVHSGSRARLYRHIPAAIPTRSRTATAPSQIADSFTQHHTLHARRSTPGNFSAIKRETLEGCVVKLAMAAKLEAAFRIEGSSLKF